jgi:hypothetical protein
MAGKIRGFRFLKKFEKFLRWLGGWPPKKSCKIS